METRKKKKAVVLLSGGMDSATALAIARAEGFETYALSFDYRQRHWIELESAKVIASAMKAARHLVVSFNLRDIGGSALTSEWEVPKEGATSRKRGGEKAAPLIPVTYVPARNTIFLSFALAWAEVLGAADIFIGANAIDYSGYPDCRPEYLHAFEAMANLATKASVEGTLTFAVRAPLISMKKSAIIRRGRELGLDFGLTWSCYDPQKKRDIRPSPPQDVRSMYRPCGRCDSCRLRAKGFREAGLEDPLVSLYDI
jgi:7-cyano-7-deazaguanine synthase